MSSARYLIGDVFERMRELPDGSIDLVLTSPPFLALRSYLPDDHPDKAKEIGSELTPAEFIDTLLRLTAEWRRLLAPHGSIAVELGDTYSGSGGTGGDYAEGGLRAGQPGMDGSAKRERWKMDAGSSEFGRGKQVRPGGLNGAGWPMPKSLVGIPHLYHLSLAYGRNLLTGEPSPAGEWRVRNVVAWCRPNPPVGELGDKFRPGTSYLTIATISRTRYFDLDAVRTPHQEPIRTNVDRPKRQSEDGQRADGGDDRGFVLHTGNAGGAPPLDWWQIPTQPYKGAHYATWPAALCERPIASMVPPRVCTVCGEPSRRIVEHEGVGARAVQTNGGTRDELAGRATTQQATGMHYDAMIPTTTGWTDCDCETFGKWRRGVVLDPFAGSGTTLAVATGHGRDAIGIDLDERNADLARARVGMFLDIEYPTRAAG